jgi:hypothetical protein
MSVQRPSSFSQNDARIADSGGCVLCQGSECPGKRDTIRQCATEGDHQKFYTSEVLYDRRPGQPVDPYVKLA